MTALTEARERLSEIIDEVVSTGSNLISTKHGEPAAGLIGYEEYESFLETLDILADSVTIAALAGADRDLPVGNLVDLD